VFDDMVAHDAFAEWNWVHGRRYGTSILTVRNALSQGSQVLLDIDYQGATRIRDAFPDTARLVFILPPSFAILEARLRGRGTDAEDVISARLRKAREELSHFGMYHYLLLNRDLEVGYQELSAVYRAELSRARGQTPSFDDNALSESCLTENRQVLAEQILAGGEANVR
jgi:guanylate kinase